MGIWCNLFLLDGPPPHAHFVFVIYFIEWSHFWGHMIPGTSIFLIKTHTTCMYGMYIATLATSSLHDLNDLFFAKSWCARNNLYLGYL